MPNAGREQALDALGAAEAESFGAWFFENAIEGFVISRGDQVISINPAWTTLTGWSDADMVERAVDGLVHPDDAPLVAGLRETLARDGRGGFQHRLLHKDGHYIWLDVTAVLRPGEVMLFTVRDISRQREQEAETLFNARISDLLRQAAGISLWRFDPDTRSYIVETGNGAGEFGSEDISPERMGDNIHPDDRAGFAAAFLPSVSTGEPGHYAYRYARRDGQPGWINFRTAWRGVRQAANGKWEVHGLTQDVTEIEEARLAAVRGEQSARDAADVKSRFLANMSHEIRTPLNGVLGVLHLLKNEGMSADGHDLIRQALACGEMLTQLLNDVLDFSKIEAGRLELNPEPLDPVATLDGVIGMLRPGAEERGLYLRSVVVGDPGWVSVDPVRLRQVLFNLIGNAAKFTLRGGVEVRMTSVGAGAGHRLRVDVQDTGVGVSKEAMNSLFERFHQADGSTTRRFGGTGLGLAITRALVEQMGGEVSAVSAAGQGSTFTFEIAAPTAGAVDEAAGEDDAWLEGLRILVVEDNPTNRLIARRMLESLGARVETADNGAEGVEAACRQAFDLVFMDIQMPVMDGVEATRRIRALGGAVAKTPIVAMTANVMKHQVSDYLAAGMDGAVAKPLNPSAILQELARLSGEDGADAAA